MKQIQGEIYAFINDNVENAPNQPGVYALYRDYKVIYYGSATISIRTRLQAHKRGDCGYCTKNATHYRREVCSNPRSREQELLDHHRDEHGDFPQCNERDV